jgi:hypothetical protein
MWLVRVFSREAGNLGDGQALFPRFLKGRWLATIASCPRSARQTSRSIESSSISLRYSDFAKKRQWLIDDLPEVPIP